MWVYVDKREDSYYTIWKLPDSSWTSSICGCAGCYGKVKPPEQELGFRHQIDSAGSFWVKKGEILRAELLPFARPQSGVTPVYRGKIWKEESWKRRKLEEKKAAGLFPEKPTRLTEGGCCPQLTSAMAESSCRSAFCYRHPPSAISFIGPDYLNNWDQKTLFPWLCILLSKSKPTRCF